MSRERRSRGLTTAILVVVWAVAGALCGLFGGPLAGTWIMEQWGGREAGFTGFCWGFVLGPTVGALLGGGVGWWRAVRRPARRTRA